MEGEGISLVTATVGDAARPAWRTQSGPNLPVTLIRFEHAQGESYPTRELPITYLYLQIAALSAACPNAVREETPSNVDGFIPRLAGSPTLRASDIASLLSLGNSRHGALPAPKLTQFAVMANCTRHRRGPMIQRSRTLSDRTNHQW